MTPESILNDAMRLNRAQRIALAQQLWDSIADGVDDLFPLTDIQKEALDRELEDFRRNPDRGEPWEVVKERLENQLKQERD